MPRYTSDCDVNERVRMSALADAFNKLLERKKYSGERNFTAYDIAGWYSPEWVKGDKAGQGEVTKRSLEVDKAFTYCIGSDAFEHYEQVARMTCAFEYQCGMGPRMSGGINVTFTDNDRGDI